MTNGLTPDIKSKVDNWLEGAYSEESKEQVRTWLRDQEWSVLTDAFYRELEFGTGGLRGVMGAGTNRVNRYTVARATQGLSNYLNRVVDGDISVVVTHDSRNRAEEFAQLVADVFSANGIWVYLFDGMRPTPELSYAIRKLRCQSGVMLTASHNPKEYSGYKAYWADGGQVISPHDKEIIAEVNAISGPDGIRTDADPSRIERLGEEMDEAFIEVLLTQRVRPEAVEAAGDVGIVYSPIHGTGVELVPATLKAAGFRNVSVVESQSNADGNFPTVVYPNPEEEEALTLAIEQARESGADLVMATDPDADRVGVVVRNTSGELELLNGNQTAALLFDYVLSGKQEVEGLKPEDYVVKTIVTSSLLDRLADHYGVECFNVLTGFKYIGELMTRLEGSRRFLVGGEESYGYLVGEHVRDKDAVVSCLLIAEMAAWYQSQGSSLYGRLQEIYREFGVYRERLVSVKKAGKKGGEEIAAMMRDFREEPPKRLGGVRVVTIRDYQSRLEKQIESGEERSMDLPKSNVLQFETERGDVVSVRPSGTEPKIKFYVSVHSEPSVDDPAEMMAGLEERIDHILNELNN
ncbi:MAG: phospho-sugar mutase [Bacteroidota bacterium]